METNKRHCRDCGQLKTRVENGKYPDGKNKRYVDEEGKHWSGSRCPACVVLQSKEVMRKNRLKKKLEAEYHSKEET